jgi:hypothetical protein
MIPKYRTLFDPDNSLYDAAFQKFPGVVMLTEHFRCLPLIIAFSNAYAYNTTSSPCATSRRDRTGPLWERSRCWTVTGTRWSKNPRRTQSSS